MATTTINTVSRSAENDLESSAPASPIATRRGVYSSPIDTTNVEQSTHCSTSFRCVFGELTAKFSRFFRRSSVQTPEPVLFPAISFSEIISEIDKSRRHSAPASLDTVKIRSNKIMIADLLNSPEIDNNSCLLYPQSVKYCSPAQSVHFPPLPVDERWIIALMLPCPTNIEFTALSAVLCIQDYERMGLSITDNHFTLLCGQTCLGPIDDFSDVTFSLLEICQLLNAPPRDSFEDFFSSQMFPQASPFEPFPVIHQRVIPRASFGSFKRSSSSSFVRRLPLIDTADANKKARTVARSNARDEKHSFIPQMNFLPTFPFSIDVKTDTTECLEQLSEQLKLGIDVNHKLDPTLVSLLGSIQTSLNKGDLPAALASAKLTVGVDPASLRILSILCVVLGSAIAHSVNPSTATLSIFVGSIAVGVMSQNFLSLPGISEVLRYVSSYISTFTETTPQMSSDLFENIISSLVMMMITYLSGSQTKKPWMASIIEQVLSFRKNFDSFDLCARSIVSVVESIVNYVRLEVLHLPSLRFLDSANQDINDFSDRCKSVYDALHLKTFSFTAENASLVHQLWTECSQLISKLPKGSQPSLVTHLNNTLHFLSSIKKTLDGMNLSFQGSRVETVGAGIFGPPGAGKSNVMQHIAYAYLARVLPKEKLPQFHKNPQSFIYNRQAETVYWDGYDFDKWVTFIDDLGQMRDVAGNPDNEWMNWIRMISTFEYVLHVAALEKKGHLRFCSRLVLVNSNRRNFNVESIVEIEAAKRRFDVSWVFVPKPEYCSHDTRVGPIWSRRLDGSLLPIGSLGITELTPASAEFHEIDMMRGVEGEFTGKVHTFNEVVEMLVEISNLKELRYKQYQLNVTDTLKEFDLTVPQADFSSFLSRGLQVFSPVPVDTILLFRKQLSENPHQVDFICLLIGKFNEINGYLPSWDVCLQFYFSYYGKDFLDVANYDLENFFYFMEDTGLQPVNSRLLSVPYLQTTNESISKMLRFFQTSFSEITTLLSKSTAPALQFGKHVFSVLRDNIGTVSCVLAVLATVGVTSQVISWFKASIAVFFPEDYSGKPQRPRGKVGRKARSLKEIKASIANHLPSTTYLAQSALKYDANNVSIIDKVTRRNCYELWLPDQQQRTGFATFIRGTVFMMPRHFLTTIDATIQEYPNYAKALVTFKKCASSVTFQFPMECLLNVVSSTDLESLDTVFVKLPRTCTNHCDISKFFVTQQQLAAMREINFRLVLPGVSIIETWMGKAEMIESFTVTAEDSYVLQKGFRYQAMTKPGDCSGLFTIINGPAVIAGHHVAGNPSHGSGLSCVITREDVLRGLIDTNEIIEEFEDEAFPQSVVPLLDGRFKESYHHTLRISSSGNSKIIPSRMHSSWGPALTAPCKLRPFYAPSGERIDPYSNALSNYCTPFVYMDPSIMSNIGDALLDELEHSSSFPVARRVLSFEESILGIQGESAFEKISRSTSPGFPYNAKKGKKFPGKTEIFGTGDTYDLNTPLSRELRANCTDIVIKCNARIRSTHIYTDCLKDERRKLDKVASGATRLFASCPLELLIIMRQYFGSFVLWCQLNHTRNGFAVGANPYSTDWQDIANRLLRFGHAGTRNIGAGDFSKYDGSEKPAIHWPILDMINRWYSDGNDQIREVLWLEVVNSKHIHEDLVYEWVSSNSSGCPLTTLINNLYNRFTAMYVWYKEHNFAIASLYTFHDNVTYITLGDDNVFAVNPLFAHLFNEAKMASGVSDLGMIYTTETKEAVTGQLRNITEVSFLKRSFRYEPLYDRYCAPLDMKTILESPYWTKDSSDSEVIAIDNLNNSLRELALHPEPVWKEWSPKLIASLVKNYGVHPKCTSRRALIAIVDGAHDWY